MTAVVRDGYICEDVLRSMPADELLSVLATSQDRTTLTFAAEVVGGLPTEVAEPALLPLLDHVSPVVREGAIIGLDAHTTDRVWAKFLEMTDSDPSPGIRSILAYRVQERRGCVGSESTFVTVRAVDATKVEKR